MNTKLEMMLVNICDTNNLELENEVKFVENRRFKADYAIPSKMILIEYEGGIYMPKSGHTNAKGYTSNCDKYNLAQRMGWKVYRFTADHFSKERESETYDFLCEVLK